MNPRWPKLLECPDLDTLGPEARSVVEYAYGITFTLRRVLVPGSIAERENQKLIDACHGILYQSCVERGMDVPRALQDLRDIRESARSAYLRGWTLADWLSGADRAGAHVLVRDLDGNVLLQHRSDDAPTAPGLWTIPGGGLERGESPRQAALRELIEETGLTKADLIGGDLESIGSLVIGWSSRDGARVRHHLFRAKTRDARIRCGEGQELRFLTLAEIRSLPLGAVARQALKGYL